MLFDQPVFQIAAEGLGRDPRILERGFIGLLVEFAGGALEGGDLEDLAVHQIVARTQAMGTAILAHGVATDQLFDHRIKSALRDEFGHGQRRVLLACAAQFGVRGRWQIAQRNVAAADHRELVPA